jgi:hypothetical protein
MGVLELTLHPMREILHVYAHICKVAFPVFVLALHDHVSPISIALSESRKRSAAEYGTDNANADQ